MNRGEVERERKGEREREKSGKLSSFPSLPSYSDRLWKLLCVVNQQTRLRRVQGLTVPHSFAGLGEEVQVFEFQRTSGHCK